MYEIDMMFCFYNVATCECAFNMCTKEMAEAGNLIMLESLFRVHVISQYST